MGKQGAFEKPSWQCQTRESVNSCSSLLKPTKDFQGFERGNFPHQWALGDFAYPTHSLQKYETKALAEAFGLKTSWK